MEPTNQTKPQQGTFLYRFAAFLVPALIVYAAGAFLWVFTYEVRDSLWFGIYCCAPMLAIVVWAWVDIRRRRRLHVKQDHEGADNG